MATIVIPKLDAATEYALVSGIIDATGRNVTITYITSRGPCPVCSGSDPFCLTCNGSPTVDVTATSVKMAGIKWAGTDKKKYAPEGQYMEGDCLIRFSAHSSGYEEDDSLLRKALYVVVDGRRCVIDRWYFRGSPINRIYVVLKVDSSEDGDQRIG